MQRMSYVNFSKASQTGDFGKDGFKGTVPSMSKVKPRRFCVFLKALSKGEVLHILGGEIKMERSYQSTFSGCLS